MAVVTGFVSLIPSIGGLLASLIVAIPCLLLGSTVFVDMPNEVFALLVMVINVVITQVTYNFCASTSFLDFWEARVYPDGFRWRVDC